MTTIWSTTCSDAIEDVDVTIRIERAADRFDLHIHFPAPCRRPELGPIDVLLRDLRWTDVLVWFDRYRARHGWVAPRPPASPPRPRRRGHDRSARAERPRRTYARTQPWGPAAPLACAS